MTTAHLTHGTRLCTQRLPDGTRQLLAPLSVDLGVKIHELHNWAIQTKRTRRVFTSIQEGTTVIRVPTGFRTNYTSGPPTLVTLLVGRWDRHDIASVVHDALVEWEAPAGPAARAWWIVARSGENRVGPFGGFAGRVGLALWNFFVYRPKLKGAII